MLQKTLLFSLFTLFTSAFLQNCDTTEPGNKYISLSVEDVSSTEVWLNVKTELTNYPQNIDLYENGEFKYNFETRSSDTTLFIKFLQPSTQYSFLIQKQHVQSNAALVTTLDTTSHNVNWQSFTFGGNGSSHISDVAIIDENNIWAVGMIYTFVSDDDSNFERYNAAHWNGIEWKLHKLWFFAFCPQQTGTVLSPASSIFAFDENNIWISAGSRITHFNGTDQLKTECIPVSVNKIWGLNNTDLYVVGYGGGIAHFNGLTWRKLDSGTDVDLTDVYGNEDGSIVWACGRNRSTGGTVIIEIKNENVSIVFNANSEISYNGLWVNGNEVTAVGTRIRRYHYTINHLEPYYVIENEADKRIFDPGVYIYSATGTGKNDVFIAGGYGSLWHFNGSSWYNYKEEYKSDRRIVSIDVKDNIVVATGNEGWPGLILVGKR